MSGNDFSMDPVGREICLKIRLGDKKAFNILFKAYYRPLYHYAFDILREPEMAEEIVHDVFIKIWDFKESFDVKTSLRGYLYRSTHNRCLNYLRNERNKKKENRFELISINDDKNKVQLFNLETPPEIIEKLFSEQTEIDIKKALETLPEQCKNVFYLSRFMNLTYPEIAIKLNLSLSTVKTQMLRAIAKMKAALESNL